MYKIGVVIIALIVVYRVVQIFVVGVVLATNYIIDYFTPLMLSIVLSIIVAMASYKTLMNIYSILMTIVMKNKQKVVKAATTVAIILILISFGVKFMNVEHIEKGFLSYQTESMKIVYNFDPQASQALRKKNKKKRQEYTNWFQIASQTLKRILENNS